MESDACRPIVHRDDEGLDEDPLTRQQERGSEYFRDYLDWRRPQETFREYLQRRIVNAHHRKQFPAPYGGPKMTKEHARLVRHFKNLYGAQAFIRYWRSNPPPPRQDP